jgi:hypothetical protein
MEWKKDIDQIRSLQKGSRKGKLFHPAQFPVLEDRLHTLILEKRQLGRKIGENWIRRCARIEFEKLWPEKVTIVEKKKVFSGMVFSNGWFTAFFKRKNLRLRQLTKEHRLCQETTRIRSPLGYSSIDLLKLSSISSAQR